MHYSNYKMGVDGGYSGMKSLKGFLLYGAIIGTVIMLVLIYAGVSIGYTRYVTNQTIERAEVMAELTVNSLNQLMNDGWTRQELELFLEGNEKNYKEKNLTVTYYDRQTRKREVVEVFENAKPYNLLDNDSVSYFYPMKMDSQCLTCHSSLQEGEVLGVVKVTEDLTPSKRVGTRDTLLFLLFLLPFPIGGAFLISRILIGRIERSISELQNRIKRINKTDDLKLLEMNNIDLAFEEINLLYSELKKLAKLIRSISVDKDILEFEVKLMEKFIITSEVVKDWKEHVNILLVEINKIMEVHLIFSLFKVDGEDYVLEVFWLHTPEEKTKELLERVIKEKLAKSHLYVENELVNLHISHNIVLPDKRLPDLDEESINFQTKSLFLDTPRIGGIVGIGVSSSFSGDTTRALVVEGILTTLLNVIGSVKAVYKYTKELEYFATRDPLTNLYTQRVFWELLNYEVSRANRHNYKFSVIVIDLDDFKLVNDIYGHLFGDKFLQETSQMIKGCLRNDDILARYGGDEYTIILPYAAQEQAFFVAERILNELKNHTIDSPNNTSVKVSPSIGVAVYPDHADDAKNLFLIADNMMYKAKSLGKSQIGLPSSDDIMEIFKTIKDKNTLILEALEENKIVPYFQPIKDTQTEEIIANEVLMRIDLPEQVMVASDFIEIAESMGIISKLDYMLIEKAFEKVNKENYQGMLFLNLSPKALIVNDFLQNVRKLVEKYRINPQKIVFEITERDTVKNLSMLSKFVLELKHEGFKFAVDDFGSGFSSFQYIKRLPIDYLKIEGDFIRSLPAEEDIDRAIVMSIVTLAQGMGITTIAEFVEDTEVYQLISELGIDYAQGYHVGRPSPKLGVRHPKRT